MPRLKRSSDTSRTSQSRARGDTLPIARWLPRYRRVDLRELPGSTRLSPSCKHHSHELVERQRRAARVSPRQSQRGADPRALELIARKGPADSPLRRRRARPGSARRRLSPLSGSGRSAGRCGGPWLRSVHAGAQARLWGGPSDPFAAFERLGRAYLEFARSEPAYYSAMFEAGIRSTPMLNCAMPPSVPSRCCARRPRVDRAHAGGAPPAADDGAARLGHVAWHRFAVRPWRCRPATLPMSPEELLEAGILVYLRGLGLPAPK